jgi:hypothetical protein
VQRRIIKTKSRRNTVMIRKEVKRIFRRSVRIQMLKKLITKYERESAEGEQMEK